MKKETLDSNIYTSKSVNDKWEKVKHIMKTSAEDCLRKGKILLRKSWLSKEIIDLMLERRDIRNKNDDISIQEYKKLTNKITTKCRECKKNETLEVCEQIEKYMQKGQMDKAYNIIRSTDKKYTTKSTAILDEKGNILINNSEILDRWKRYIEELYKGHGLDENDIVEEQLVEENERGPTILKQEFLKP